MRGRPPMEGAGARRAAHLSVEGVIAAGKTALVDALAEELRARGRTVAVAREPVDAWRASGALARFYADPARHGYAFQTYVWATRVRAICAAHEAAPDADVYLYERTPESDRLFMALLRGTLPDHEHAMYAEWCDAHRRALPVPMSGVTAVYLRTDLGDCGARLRARARAEEVGGGVSAEYLGRLAAAHDAWLGLAPPDPAVGRAPYGGVVVVPPEVAAGDYRAPGAARDRVVGDILRAAGLDA